MFSLCLLTVCGLFTNSKKLYGVPGFPPEMENQVKSLHVLTYYIYIPTPLCTATKTSDWNAGMQDEAYRRLTYAALFVAYAIDRI